MSPTSNRQNRFWSGDIFRLVIALSVILSFGKAGLAAEGVEHYKMLSTLEYSGKGQFASQVETLFTVRKESLSGNRVRYLISTDDFDMVSGTATSGRTSPKKLSFVIDRKTRHMSEGGKVLVFLEKVTNECVRSLKHTTKKNIGKTWKQPFNLSFFDYLVPSDLKFTLTAIPLKTKVFGELIAVRALSKPFSTKTIKQGGGTGTIQSKVGAVYLFGPEMEDIYMSISVFEAKTNINGFKETLRHEMATYKTDATGTSADLSGLSKKFEKLAKKLRLSRKKLKVVKRSSLPQWARYEGLAAAQLANICAATACEGTINPVSTIYVPAARTVAMQSSGTLMSVGTVETVSGALANEVPAVRGMNLAAGPTIMGVGVGTADAVAGATVGTVAIAGGFSSDSSNRSPY